MRQQIKRYSCFLHKNQSHIHQKFYEHADLLSIQRKKQIVNSRILIMQLMYAEFQIFDDFMGFIPACDVKLQWKLIQNLQEITHTKLHIYTSTSKEGIELMHSKVTFKLLIHQLGVLSNDVQCNFLWEKGYLATHSDRRTHAIAHHRNIIWTINCTIFCLGFITRTKHLFIILIFTNKTSAVVR